MSNQESDLQKCRQVVVHLVSHVVPEELDVIDDGFDSLAEVNFQPPPRDPRHAFDIGDAWPYAMVICTTIGNIFKDAMKDTAKEVFKNALAGWKQWVTDDAPPISDQQIADMMQTVETAGSRLGISAKDRERMKGDLGQLLRKFPQAALLDGET